MKKLGNFKYEVESSSCFPVIIDFYLKDTEDYLGFIEIYKNGIFYSNMLNGIDYKLVIKMLKIANKERCKLVLRKKWRGY